MSTKSTQYFIICLFLTITSAHSSTGPMPNISLPLSKGEFRINSLLININEYLNFQSNPLAPINASEHQLINLSHTQYLLRIQDSYIQGYLPPDLYKYYEATLSLIHGHRCVTHSANKDKIPLITTSSNKYKYTYIKDKNNLKLFPII